MVHRRILVVEDEKKIQDIIKSYLVRDGFHVDVVDNGRDGLDFVRQKEPHLVILDLMLPEMDGFDVMREIRKRSSVPIIILSARVDAEDRVAGLELGADDFVAKPFNPQEVVARVRSVLRRVGNEQPADLVSVGKLEVNIANAEARWDGALLPLTNTEFKLLGALASHPGRVYSRESLLEALRGASYAGDARTIDAHIKNIRRKLQEASLTEGQIATVPGVGYKLAIED